MGRGLSTDVINKVMEDEAIEFAEWILDNEFIKQSDGIQRWWGKNNSEVNYDSKELYQLFKNRK